MKRWKRVSFVMGMLLCMSMVLGGCRGSSGANPSSDEGAGTTTTSAVTPGSLSEQELAEIQAFLRDVSNYGFLGSNVYTHPEDVHLSNVLYDGAGLKQTLYQDWSEEELLDVLGTTHWENEHLSPFKVSKADVDALLRQKLGISMESLTAAPSEKGSYTENKELLRYSKKYDACYVVNGGGAYLVEAQVSSGEINEDGLYVIHYSSRPSSNYTVTLRKVEGGYQFISNIEI